jgi:serine/threonine-protein kinase PRP4
MASLQANIGEVLEGRYKILGTSGRGVFSTVLICEDLKDLCRVAIKVIKTNETMRRAGEKELELLEVS